MGARNALALTIAIVFWGALASNGHAKSMAVVQVQLRGHEIEVTAETTARLGKLVAPAADRDLLSPEEAHNRLKRSVVVPPQHETTKRLEDIYAEIRHGDELLYTDPQQAIPVLDKARKELEQILEKLAIDDSVHEKLFQTQMLLARSHMDNGDKDAAIGVITEIIRQFGERNDVTEDNYHPRLVALYKKTLRRLQRKRTAKLLVKSAGEEGLEILLNRRPVIIDAKGTTAKTPYEIKGLLPGHYHVQVRRSKTDVSKIHKVALAARSKTTTTIDVAFDQALTVGETTLSLTFNSLDAMQKKLAEYSARVGVILEVDEVLAAGLLDRPEGRQLYSVRLDVPHRKIVESVELPVKGKTPGDRQFLLATQVLCGLKEAPAAGHTRLVAPEEIASAAWYTDWIGWSLVGVGVASMGVGGYFISDYGSKSDCAGDVTCKTEPERVKLADDALTSRNVSYAMFGLGGAAIVGGVLVFVLRDRSPETPRTAWQLPERHPSIVPFSYGEGAGLLFTTPF